MVDINNECFRSWLIAHAFGDVFIEASGSGALHGLPAGDIFNHIRSQDGEIVVLFEVLFMYDYGVVHRSVSSTVNFGFAFVNFICGALNISCTFGEWGGGYLFAGD